MPASIHRLISKKERLNQEQADLFRDALSQAQEDNPDVPWPEDAVREVFGYLDRLTTSNNGWNFVLVSPQVNAEVGEYLEEHARRPMKAVRVWNLLLTALDSRTGRVLLSREQIAQGVGVDANYVSKVMRCLEDCGAISRRRVVVPGMPGRGEAHYFLSAIAATHLAGAARDKAQATAPVLRTKPLYTVEGGRPA